MSKKEKKSKALVITKTCFFAFCIFMISWFLLVSNFGPDKTYTNTYNVGVQAATNDAKEYAIEVNYFSNENKNGLEMFEVKFNYLTDENKTALHSQGLQFVANSQSDSLDWNYYVDDSAGRDKDGGERGWYTGEWHYNVWGSMQTDKSTSQIFNYESDDNYETVWESTNPLENDATFRFSIGEDVFLVSLKDKNTPMEDLSYYSNREAAYKFWLVFGYHEVNYYYTYYDVNFLSYLLFQAVSSNSIKAGTTDIITTEIADIFDYQILKDGQFVDVDNKNVDSIKEKVFNYYSIKVNKSANGARKASEDSIFNSIQGDSNYNTMGDFSVSDYFYGRTVISVTIDDFDYVYVHDNKNVMLKLSKEFLSYRKPFKDKIVLSITIDKDQLLENGYHFAGFTEDSGLDDFEIYKCISTQTIDGEIVELEVAA